MLQICVSETGEEIPCAAFGPGRQSCLEDEDLSRQTSLDELGICHFALRLWYFVRDSFREYLASLLFRHEHVARALSALLHTFRADRFWHTSSIVLVGGRSILDSRRSARRYLARINNARSILELAGLRKRRTLATRRRSPGVMTLQNPSCSISGAHLNFKARYNMPSRSISFPDASFSASERTAKCKCHWYMPSVTELSL